MNARRQPQVETNDRVTHPARGAGANVDVKAMHDRISKRFPRVLAELAK